jgi:hypothetical protein
MSRLGPFSPNGKPVSQPAYRPSILAFFFVFLQPRNKTFGILYYHGTKPNCKPKR